MLELEIKLREIEESINEYIIDLGDNYLSVPARLAYFELDEYSKVIIELNKERYSMKSYDEKKYLKSKYQQVYKASKKMYSKLLKNIKNKTLKIECDIRLESNKNYLYEILGRSFAFNERKLLYENICMYMEFKMKQRIHEINIELHRLKDFPNTYINTINKFIGPNSITKYDKDIFFYKDVYIAVSEMHHFSVFYNENSKEETKNALLNIIAYFNGQPYFYFTENYNFNRKIGNLYEQFDLLDLLRLRKKNFFDSKSEEPFHLELPILRTNVYEGIYFKESNHEMLFELYHASLKQFESLPRCVFLYRVFEYGAEYHYLPMFKPSDYNPEDALNYYANEVLKYNFIPLYYVDFGTYVSNDGKSITKKRKAKYVNFISKLKTEIKVIKKEWSVHSYLKDKSIGSIIYGTGRNATAHGASGRRTARYDYSKNYKHINDVNIFLELIARYIVEALNPQLINIVERRTKYYIEYNNYQKIFGLEK